MIIIDFHYMNANDKEFSISVGVRKHYSLGRIIAEIANTKSSVLIAIENNIGKIEN